MHFIRFHEKAGRMRACGGNEDTKQAHDCSNVMEAAIAGASAAEWGIA
jgi:hypothetical protein